jgi:hypothetical protein
LLHRAGVVPLAIALEVERVQLAGDVEPELARTVDAVDRGRVETRLPAELVPREAVRVREEILVAFTLAPSSGRASPPRCP